LKPSKRVWCLDRAGLAALLLTALPAASAAQGGPPLITDDPDTPGPGYWEINLSTFLERRAPVRRIEVPRLDLNVGIGRRIQLKFEVPHAGVSATDGPALTGAGNAAAGVKWRFLGEEGRRLAWSIYPQVEFAAPMSSVAKGLATPDTSVTLPTEFTVEFAHLELNFEVGRVLVAHAADEWTSGVATEAGLTKHLELVAEFHAEGPDAEPQELIVNVGGRLKLTRHVILMLAAGRIVRSALAQNRGELFYAGLQFNLPGQYPFDRQGRRPRQALAAR
jgi:hypothetical protein